MGLVRADVRRGLIILGYAIEARIKVSYDVWRGTLLNHVQQQQTRTPIKMRQNGCKISHTAQYHSVMVNSE